MNTHVRLHVVFYRTPGGHEPVREWPKQLSRAEKKIIGEDLKTVQFGGPLGIPLIRKLDPGIWEVRSHLQNRIARVLFTIISDRMILLHEFIKKSQKTPKDDITLAKKRLTDVRSRP